MDRLVALELAGILTPLVVVLMAEGFDCVLLYDVALSLALLSVSSTLLLAHFLERWL
jgi:multisubunit Na+/H+ antiporter MnhF subunit